MLCCLAGLKGLLGHFSLLSLSKSGTANKGRHLMMFISLAHLPLSQGIFGILWELLGRKVLSGGASAQWGDFSDPKRGRMWG